MTTPSVNDSPRAIRARPRSVSRLSGDLDRPDVLRARNGDQNAFAPLWERHWRTLFRYFACRVSSREEAEDLASDTLLAAFDQLPAFRGLGASEMLSGFEGAADAAGAGHCSFKTYLYGIARFKLSHWVRRKANRNCVDFAELEPAANEGEEMPNTAECLGADAGDDPLAALLAKDNLDEVCYALADVGMRSSEQFKALFFHYLCELSHKDVASVLDSRAETINTRLQEGRRTLTRFYKHAEEHLTAPYC